ncbi:hypothetical protein H8356DRAFT_1349333 [Neocallimastix lanati (nom. inval.)]|nr:hypothetical protein H8356DRAFT_1349333 [Neocallimastix sp. JGI-2020a]
MVQRLDIYSKSYWSDTISVLKKYSIESSTGFPIIPRSPTGMKILFIYNCMYSEEIGESIEMISSNVSRDNDEDGNKSILEIWCTTILRTYLNPESLKLDDQAAMYIKRYNRVNYGCEVVVTDIEVEWGTEWGTENVICENKQSTEINKEKRLKIKSLYPSSNSITTSSRDSDTLNKPVNYVIPESYYEECIIKITDAERKICGNLTSNYAKKYLYIKFDKMQKPKKKNWILLSSYKDESLVRGESVLSITHEIYNVEDYYVSDIRYVEDYESNDVNYLLEHDGVLNQNFQRSGIGDEQIAISSDVKNSSLKLNSQ